MGVAPRLGLVTWLPVKKNILIHYSSTISLEKPVHLVRPVSIEITVHPSYTAPIASTLPLSRERSFNCLRKYCLNLVIPWAVIHQQQSKEECFGRVEPNRAPSPYSLLQDPFMKKKESVPSVAVAVVLLEN